MPVAPPLGACSAAGAAGFAVAAASETTGVTTSFAVTFPLMVFYALADVVPRASRVALRFAAATAFCSAVIGVRAL